MHVLVTGANGHLGSNVIAALLAAGHRVRGTIRSLGDVDKAQHVARLGDIELVAARLDDQASLRAAMDGVDALIHTAAVYRIYAPGGEREILKASIEGVAAAMHAAKDAKVGRIVLTSSVVTLPLTAPGAPPSTEADWTDDLRVPYLKAKTLGEKRAWQLAGEWGLNLATVLPGACGGPGFLRPTPTIDFIEAIMKGAMRIAAPDLDYPYIDVRDVARAHLDVLHSDARERFIAASPRQPTMAEIATIMHDIDRTIPAPMLTLPGWATDLLPAVDSFNATVLGLPRSVTPELAGTVKGRHWNMSSAKIERELGWSPRISLRDSLFDTIAEIRTLR